MLIFIFAFGVTTQALLYPNQTADISLLGRIFLPSYFVLAGGYNLQDYVYAAIRNNISGKHPALFLPFSFSYGIYIDVAVTCESLNLTDVPKQSSYQYDPINDCPEQTGAIITLILLIIYVIVLVTLLINLLIAIFKYSALMYTLFIFESHTFIIFSTEYGKIEDREIETWKLQRCLIILEYQYKFFVYLPFRFIFNIHSLIKGKDLKLVFDGRILYYNCFDE